MLMTPHLMTQGESIEKTARIPIGYIKFHPKHDPLPPKCVFDIKNCAETVAPREKTKTCTRYVRSSAIGTSPFPNELS